MSDDHRHTNPFFYRQRITDPSYFHGRVREVEALYSAIVTRQCRSIVGERKMGKSSLLTQLSCPTQLKQHGLDPARYIFIYIDLEGMSNIAYDEFWPEVMDQLELALPDEQDSLAQMAAELASSADVRFTQVRRLLRRIERAGLTLVFMLDEFESLARNNNFDSSFYGELRSLAGELGVVYLTISKNSLYDLTYSHEDTLSSPFFNIFSEERLNLLPPEEAQGLLQHLATLRGGTPFTEEQVTFLANLAGGHPFFLQVAGHHLYEERRHNTTVDLALVERRFKAEAEDHFRYLWSQLNQEEQAAMVNLDNATPELVKQLQVKALVRQSQGQYRPFSRAFGDFLALRPAQTDRPTIPYLSGANGRGTDLTGVTLGSYRILSPIGRGGMAIVYKGYQPSLDRYVAIKVMSTQLAHEQTFIERFQREASSVAKLRHQHIVQVLDFGLHEGLSYMVMEFVDGPTLKDKLRASDEKGEHFSLPVAAQVIQDVAEALDYAHAHGIVHRDVKPANILLRPEQKLAQHTGQLPFTAVLADFGVARMLEGVQLTQTGMTVGTPDYMSPEQASGQTATLASDIYALGILLYEMLTGELPFRGDTPVAVILQHIQADPPTLSDKLPHLPYDLNEIINRALAKNPTARYSTAGEMAAALAMVSGAMNGKTSIR
jgi:tRNA A-37 threonylcarbamoyl transferase component Bud32